MPDQRGRYTVDLSPSVGVDQAPADPQPGAQLGPQPSLVEEPGGFLHLEKLAAVEGQPGTVGAGPHLRGNEDVRVQLWVTRP
jgi:hypothetical protein